MLKEVKGFIDSTVEFYRSSRKNKELLDRAVRQSKGLILFNIDTPKLLVEFPRAGFNGSYDTNLANFLDKDVFEYILSLDGGTSLVEVVVAHFIRVMSIGTTIDMSIDINNFRVVRKYVGARYRIKLRHTKIKRIILDNIAELLGMYVPEDIEIPRYKKTDTLISLYIELRDSKQLSDGELEKLKKMFTLFISKKSNLYSSLSNDVEYGLLRLYMKVNHKVIREGE